MHRLLSVAVVVALFLGATREAGAAAHPCAEVHEAPARLACYDRAFPPAGGSTGAVVDREAERQEALKNFGLTRQQLREIDPDTARDLSPGRIQANVQRVSQTAEGKRVVTLDNGQVWLLTENTSRGDLRPGHAITVREAALGTYMMVTPGGVALRARRTR